MLKGKKKEYVKKPTAFVKMIKAAEKKYAIEQVYGELGKASVLSKEKNRG